jgi:hypothetical protein
MRVAVDCGGGSMENGILSVEFAPVYVDVVGQGFWCEVSLIFYYYWVIKAPLLSVWLESGCHL